MHAPMGEMFSLIVRCDHRWMTRRGSNHRPQRGCSVTRVCDRNNVASSLNRNRAVARAPCPAWHQALDDSNFRRCQLTVSRVR